MFSDFPTSTFRPPVEEEEEGGSVDDILQVFRIFKLARIFKLGRHSPGLQVKYKPICAQIVGE